MEKTPPDPTATELPRLENASKLPLEEASQRATPVIVPQLPVDVGQVSVDTFELASGKPETAAHVPVPGLIATLA